MDMHAFGQFIAENRRTRGLTQLQLAESLHVTDKAVSKWERGLSYPDVTLLEPLAGKAGADDGGADGLPAAGVRGTERSGGTHAEPFDDLPCQRAEGAAGAPGSGWERCWCYWR